jgi:regulator of cell morphogenesis and NO signaling
MIEVSRLFDELRKDFEEHMDNEEKNLFPKIRLLSHDISKSSDAEFLRTDIDELELEHDKAGTIMQKIRTLTNNYTAPAGVCTTFHLMLDSLKAFEEDLHHHVHLENNILFPKALLLIPAPVACSCSLH